MTILLPNKTRLSLSVLCLLSISQTSYSGILENGAWQVQPGDSLYSISRQVHPGDKSQQKRFRQQLLELNPQQFAQGADVLSAGATLALPPSSPAQVVEKKPLVKPAKKPVHKAPVMIAKTKPAAVIADTKLTDDSIGKIVINIGKLEAVNNGKTRLLKRHSEIRQGDTLKTAANTHTQIRFKDGALISLKPKTEFHIAQYNYNGAEDGTERGIFELIKGGFRTITGAIGHKNKQNYQVKTAVATIGIRGTHYGLMLCAAGSCQGNNGLMDGLYGGVVDGSVVIDNQSGQHKFNNDQYFHLASAGAAPVEQLTPSPIFNQDSQPVAEDESDKKTRISEEAVSGETDKEGEPTQFVTVLQPPPPPPEALPLPKPIQPVIQNLPTLAPNGSGMLIAFDHGLNFPDPNSGEYGVAAPVFVNAYNNNQILLHDVITPDGQTISNIPLAAHESPSATNPNAHDLALRRPDGTGAVVIPSSLGGSPIGVNWGRWRGDYVVLENGNPIPHSADFHYIYSDKIVDINDPAKLAYLGGLYGNIDQAYTSIGGTRPTDRQGNVGANFANINMSANFMTREITSYTLNASVNNANYSASSGSAVLFSQLNNNVQLFGSCTGNCTAGSVSGSASLAFVGDQAQGAITSYNIAINDGSNGVTGVALLKK